MNLRGKIITGFALVIAIFAIASCIIYFQATRARQHVTDIPHQFNRNNQYARISYNVAMEIASIRGYLYYKEESFVESFRTYTKENDQIIQNLIDTAKVESNRQKAIELKNMQDDFNNLCINRIVPLLKAGHEEEAVKLARNEGVPMSNGLNNMADEMKKAREGILDADIQTTAADVGNIRYWAVLATAIALLCGGLIGFVLARSIAAPIGLVAAEAAKIAQGDLTGKKIAVKARGEVQKMAQAFNHMQANLREIARQLTDQSQAVASSSAQLSASAENVAAGADETASNIHRVAKTFEKIASNARQMTDVSAESAGLAREGAENIKNVNAQMEDIQAATASSSEVINGLNRSAAKISQILELITQIADQTNLLALNAAIEAARAGDQGRGFAVVAEEVRKLAEQSSGAAGEIYQLIASIQKESDRAVQTMTDGSARVEEGARTVDVMGGTFEKIIGSVQGLAADIQSITLAVEEISGLVQNVAATAQEQTATMEEVSSTSQNLSRLALNLEDLAGKFKV
jgi:methyl-accepting chemotaxis protein